MEGRMVPWPEGRQDGEHLELDLTQVGLPEPEVDYAARLEEHQREVAERERRRQAFEDEEEVFGFGMPRY